MLIKEMYESDKPRERLKKYGAKFLSNEELISIILRCGTKNISVKELSSNILKNKTSLNELETYTLNSLTKIKGMGEVKAITLLATIELGKRINFSKEEKQYIKLNNTSLVFEMFKYKFINKYQEEFIVLFLDTKKNLITYETLFMGTVNQSIVHPREIFKRAYLNSASSIICLHNHPSGEVVPSQSDINLTKSIKEIGEILLIPLLDHMIIGTNSYYSFLEEGTL